MPDPGEPEWLPEDTKAALEWIDYEDSLCPGCRFPKHESMDPTADEGPGRPGRYDATLMTCHACAARDRKSRIVTGDENFNSAGVYIAVTETNGHLE